jgi:hypothetical protein
MLMNVLLLMKIAKKCNKQLIVSEHIYVGGTVEPWGVLKPANKLTDRQTYES